MKLWVLELKAEAHTEHTRGKRHLFLQAGMRVELVLRDSREGCLVCLSFAWGGEAATCEQRGSLSFVPPLFQSLTQNLSLLPVWQQSLLFPGRELRQHIFPASSD